MNNSNSTYSATFYSLIAAAIGGIALGGYLSASYYYKKEEKEKAFQDIINNDNTFFNTDLPILFENNLKSLKTKIKESPYKLSEDSLIIVIELIKEYADYLFERRNIDKILERRKLLYTISKCEPDSEEAKLLTLKYEELSSREYFDLYNFALSTSKTYILKKIKLNKKVLEEHWEKFSQNEEIYYKINYFSNLFNNLNFDDNEPKFKKEFIKKLFEEYSQKLIDDVANLENELAKANLTNEEKDDAYGNRLQLIKLRISDGMFIKHKIDDRLLKYLAINIHKLHVNDENIKILLEKINGIDLISIGL